MNKQAIVLAVESQGFLPSVFADAMMEAKDIRISGERDESALTGSLFTGGVIGVMSALGAASLGSILAPITVISMGAVIAYAIGDHAKKVKPAMESAREIEQLLGDATSEEWAALGNACGTPEDFSGCLRAGMLEGHRSISTKGTLYHAALAHAHGLGKALPSEYEPIAKTGLARPVALSWRERRSNAQTLTVEVAFAPTNADLDIIGRVAQSMSGFERIKDEVAALFPISKASAIHLTLSRSGAIDRDFVAAGVEMAELHKIRKWAKDGQAEAPKALAPAELQATHGEALTVVEPVEANPLTLSTQTSETPAPAELQAPTPTAAAPSFGVSKTRNPLDILVAALFSHRAFYGGQRTGKSLLAAAASSGIVQKAPGTKVFYLNLFAFDHAETLAMFSHAYKTVIVDLAGLRPEQAMPSISNAYALFQEFTVTTGAVLIIDEASSMGDIRGEHIEALSPLIHDLVGHLGSIRDSSKKRRKAVWTIAPGIVAGNLDDGMKSLMKGFPPVLVSIPKDRSVDWEGQALTTDTTITGQLKVNYPGASFEVPAMDCDRVCFIDSVWMPLGVLMVPVMETEAALAKVEALPSAPARSRRGRITIPTRAVTTDTRQELEQAWEVAPSETFALDAAMELINEESNAAKREALTIAYQWARARQDRGDVVERQTFIERARKDRSCEYLKDNRDEIWEELQGLLA